MPIGLDEASAIAGLISLCVTLLNGCIKGFVLISHARKCERQISNIDLNFELEQLKLCYWAEQAGLFETPAQLHFDAPIRGCVQRVLSQLKSMLTDVRQLKKVYKLDLVETSEEITSVQSDQSALGHLNLKHVPEVQRLNNNVAAVFHKSTKLSPWLRLRWLAVDETHYRLLLDDVSRLIAQLLQLPRLNGGKGLDSTLDTLYRTAIINNNTVPNLDLLIESFQDKSMTAMTAPARLKKKFILSGLFRRPRRSSLELQEFPQGDHDNATKVQCPQAPLSVENTAAPRTESKRLRNQHLILPDAIQAHSARQLAYYNNRPVLIEWRSVDGYYWRKMESRAARFCDILQEMAQFPSFHSLPCIGFLKESHTGRYGYVFELTSYSPSISPNLGSTTVSRPPLPVVKNLHDMISNTLLMPSLNVRLSYSIVLLETILQLHTAGWLHKELRSNNILLIAQSNGEYLDHELLDSPMFLAGYTYARADDPDDFTEIVRPEEEADLYRHPLALLGHDRRSYCRGFDIFSVGCILLELGLWLTLPDMLCRRYQTPNFERLSLTPPQTPRQSSDILLAKQYDIDLQILRQRLLAEVKAPAAGPGSILQHLQAQVGRTFASVIVEFLNVTIVDCFEGSGLTEHEYILDLEKRALDQLRGLAERL